MADNTFNSANEAVTKYANSVRETNQAIMKSVIEAQERNVRFAQSVFENGIEVLKNQADSTRSLLQSVGEKPQDQQNALEEVVNNTVAAQERNIRFVQGVFENGIEVLKSHADSTRSLMNTVAE
ncbi:MAG: hypothetical protein M3Z24_15755, partial [Chloroflexota bacterium]|nr:hypothetical protein [Chloroflexota bacterium]